MPVTGGTGVTRPWHASAISAAPGPYTPGSAERPGHSIRGDGCLVPHAPTSPLTCPRAASPGRRMGWGRPGPGARCAVEREAVGEGVEGWGSIATDPQPPRDHGRLRR